MKSSIHIPILVCLFAGAMHSAGPIFSTLLHGGGQEYATSVTSDAQGNVYVAGLTYSPDFPVTPGAVQPTFGQTCDAFVSKLGPDGKLMWSTYLGGILDDWATGIAVDSAGNVLVTGWTRSANFPLANALQGTLNHGASLSDYDAFVAKLDPTGSKLLYSTFLGGQDHDGASGIAVDAAGNAYVAVNSNSAAGYPGTQNLGNQSGIFVSKLNPQGGLVYSFFHPNGTAGAIALDAAGNVYVTGANGIFYLNGLAGTTQAFPVSGVVQAMVFKISPDGSKKIFETVLGGSAQAIGAAIAVNSAGEVYIAGSTSSADFPLVKPLQSSTGARPLWKSTDGGSTFAPVDNLPFAIPQMLAVDPTMLTTLYEATADRGIFKSLDGGATWSSASTGFTGKNIQTVSIDPVHPQTLYASQSVPVANGGTGSAIYKTTNGGASWSPIDSPAFIVTQLAVDQQNTSVVWEIGATLRKSTDAGVTWTTVTFPGPGVVSAALDPGAAGHLFAVSSFVYCSFNCGGAPSVPFLYRSVDGGATWIQFPAVVPGAPLLVDASTSPSTVYNGLASRSVDGGITWSAITPPPGTSATLLSLDSSGAVFAGTSLGLYVSRDHGQTWAATGGSVPSLSSVAGGLVPAGATGTLYGFSNQVSAAGFVTKLSADGATLQYSTYLRGHPSFESSLAYSAEPAGLTTNNWISSIVLDQAGNATVAGGTRGKDFLTANPLQSTNAGLSDAFVTTIAADGSKLTYSTYYGGSLDDGALGVALDSQGNILLAGQTWSLDFPIPGGGLMPFSYGDAFVVKLAAPAAPVVAAVLNGASFQPGIEAGSWVMIKGAGLANTTRTWRGDDFVNGNLPTSLDGVSVTINGKPAFVYYISPTQISVQAPSDATVGAVNVVVNNNGALSAPGTAQLQAVAPAFFLEPGTNNVIASSLPAYAAVGDAAAPAKPGDKIVLWGTGFGATTPTVPAGTTVKGAPAAVTLPTVTIGGVPAQVISTVLTLDSAGLYQVTIQIPDAAPSGPVSLQASVGSVQTPTGVTIFVGKL